MKTSIIETHTIPEIVACYEQAVSDVKHAYAMLESVERRLTQAFGDTTRYRDVCVHERQNRINWAHPDESLVELRAQLWRCIVDRSEVRRFLSIEEAEKLDKALSNNEMPEITVESVRDFVDSLVHRLPKLAEDAIREVFDWLRPRAGYRNGRYKTNRRETVGERVVVESVVESPRLRGYTTSKPFGVSHWMEKRLTALENVFRALDGQGQRTRAHFSELSQAIKDSPDGTGSTAYFEFKAFQNGNLHLKFKRLDLLRKFNAAAAGKALASGDEAVA